MPSFIATLEAPGLRAVKQKGQPSTKKVVVRLESATGNPQETFDKLLELDGKRVKVNVTLEQANIE